MKINYKRCEDIAWRGEQIPTDLNALERFYALELVPIYANYRSGAIDIDLAGTLKEMTRKEIEAVAAERDFAFRCWDTAAARYRATEAARSEYRKNRTLENADKLCAAIDGVGVSE